MFSYIGKQKQRDLHISPSSFRESYSAFENTKPHRKIDARITLAGVDITKPPKLQRSQHIHSIENPNEPKWSSSRFKFQRVDSPFKLYGFEKIAPIILPNESAAQLGVYSDQDLTIQRLQNENGTPNVLSQRLRQAEEGGRLEDIREEDDVISDKRSGLLKVLKEILDSDEYENTDIEAATEAKDKEFQDIKRGYPKPGKERTAALRAVKSKIEVKAIPRSVKKEIKEAYEKKVIKKAYEKQQEDEKEGILNMPADLIESPTKKKRESTQGATESKENEHDVDAEHNSRLLDEITKQEIDLTYLVSLISEFNDLQRKLTKIIETNGAKKHIEVTDPELFKDIQRFYIRRKLKIPEKSKTANSMKKSLSKSIEKVLREENQLRTDIEYNKQMLTKSQPAMTKLFAKSQPAMTKLFAKNQPALTKGGGCC